MARRGSRKGASGRWGAEPARASAGRGERSAGAAVPRGPAPRRQARSRARSRRRRPSASRTRPPASAPRRASPASGHPGRGGVEHPRETAGDSGGLCPGDNLAARERCRRSGNRRVQPGQPGKRRDEQRDDGRLQKDTAARPGTAGTAAIGGRVVDHAGCTRIRVPCPHAPRRTPPSSCKSPAKVTSTGHVVLGNHQPRCLPFSAKLVNHR